MPHFPIYGKKKKRISCISEVGPIKKNVGILTCFVLLICIWIQFVWAIIVQGLKDGWMDKIQIRSDPIANRKPLFNCTFVNYSMASVYFCSGPAGRFLQSLPARSRLIVWWVGNKTMLGSLRHLSQIISSVWKTSTADHSAKPHLAGEAGEWRRSVRTPETDDEDGPIMQQPPNSSQFYDSSECFILVWSKYGEIFNPSCPLNL